MWRMVSDKTKILLASLAVRLFVAPFTMHLWDINTIQTSVYQFIHGANPYRYVYELTQRLRTTTDLPISYEGYTYLPHALLIFTPFYLLYTALGTDGLPIKGVADPLHVFKFHLHPDIYLFLLIMKLPLIITDLSIIYILYNYFGRKIALIYAFSPYVILITSVWGMFDNIVALTLLLTIILLRKNKFFLSGLTYGISLMKFYPVYIAPLLLYNVCKQRRLKTIFESLAGFTVSQIPTLIFVYKDPVAFFSTTLRFHAMRSGGGITPLNILWNIRDSYFNLTVSILASIITTIVSITVSIYCILKKTSLEKAVMYASVAGVLLGKVVNEQYFIPIFVLLLINSNDMAQKLSYGYLAFALINTRGFYLLLPTFTLIEQGFELNPLRVIIKILFNGFVPCIINAVLFILGTAIYLSVAILILLPLFTKPATNKTT